MKNQLPCCPKCNARLVWDNDKDTGTCNGVDCTLLPMYTGDKEYGNLLICTCGQPLSFYVIDTGDLADIKELANADWEA